MTTATECTCDIDGCPQCRIDDLQAELAGLQAQYDEAAEGWRVAGAEVALLTRTLAEERAGAETLRGQLAEANARAQRLAHGYATVEAELALERQCHEAADRELNEALDDAAALRAQLETERAASESRVAWYARRRDAARSLYREAQAQLDAQVGLRQRLVTVAGQRDRLVAAVCAHAEVARTLTSELAAARAELAELRDQVEAQRDLLDERDAAPMACRVCGCTDADCRQCIERTGEACRWVAEGLCSACVGGDREAIADELMAAAQAAEELQPVPERDGPGPWTWQLGSEDGPWRPGDES